MYLFIYLSIHSFIYLFILFHSFFVSEPVIVHCDFSTPSFPITTISPAYDKSLLKGPSFDGSMSFQSMGEIVNFHPTSFAQLREVVVSGKCLRFEIIMDWNGWGLEWLGIGMVGIRMVGDLNGLGLEWFRIGMVGD